MGKWRFAILWSVGLLLCVAAGWAETGPLVDFIRRQFDYTHDAYWVYSDSAMPENHFVALGLMSAPGSPDVVPPIQVDMACHDAPQSGYECIRSELPHGTAGACLQHGFMRQGDLKPQLNWGQAAAADDLSEAHHLTFYARGAHGGEEVEFFVGGLGRDPQTQAPKPDCPYPDIPKITTGLVQLSDRWQRFSLALPPTVARSRVINGFGWWQRARPDGSSVIFIDTISYDWARADERHLPPSFVTQDGQLAMDWAQRGFSHTYDVALAIIAMLAMGDVRRARLMADALIYAQQHDPDGNRIDGGVRNCYSGGDLVLPSGWLPTGRDGAVRLAGFWEPMKKVWWQDKYANAVYTGNVAWAGIALVHVYRATGVKKYLDAAIGMGDWILHHAELRDREGHLQSGYKGGIFYWEGKEEPVPWVATEHSIDAYVLFTLLAGADPVAKADWLGGAAHARSFVGSMWAGDHLWTGLKPDGSANRDFVPVDIQGWACLAFGPADFPGALSWALRHCSVEQLDVKGLAFRDMTGLEPDDPGRGVWPEGTAQMVVALREAGKTAEADAYLGQLRAFQRTLLAEGKTGMTAAVGERLVAIPGQQEYFRREHIGATCWCLFAEKGINPYWFGEHPPGGEGR